MKLSSLSNRPIARRACVPLIVAVICFVAAERGAMQAPNPADGPWSGSAQCVLTGQFAGQGQTYFNQQTHTWVLTSSTPGPTSTAAIKQYAATWQVTGQGTRQRGQGNNSEQWTTTGQPMPDTLTIRLTAEGNVRIGGAAQLRSTGTTTGAAIPYVDEWTFPVIEGTATQTSITGSAPQGLSANFPGAPPGTTSTVTCSWNFVRGGGAAPQPTGITRDARGALAGVITGGTASGPALGGAETVNPSPIPTAATVTAPASQETLSPASPIKAPIGPIGGLTADQPKSTQDLIGSCTLRGPGVNSNYRSYASGVMANLYWTPVGGATGYIVLRSDLGLLTPMPLPATTTLYHHPANLQLGSTYVYIVAAQYPQGCGATAFNLTPFAGTMSVGLTTTGPGLPAGTVMLSVTVPADPTPSYMTYNYSGFHVEGPGLPQGGRDFRPSTTGTQHGQLQITGVPSGSRTWSVSAYWDTSGGRINGVSRSATGSVP